MRTAQEWTRRLYNVHLDDLRRMSPDEFRHAVAFLLHKLGYHVNLNEETGHPAVDLLAWDAEKKPWIVRLRRDLDVLEDHHVREFYALLQELEIERGILVLLGTLTPAARAWTQRAHVYLWDGERLVRMLQLAAGRRWKVEEV